MFFRGGCTIVFDLDSKKLRYAIRKPVNSHNGDGEARRERQRKHRQEMNLRLGLRGTYFSSVTSSLQAHEPFAMLHADVH